MRRVYAILLMLLYFLAVSAKSAEKEWPEVVDAPDFLPGCAELLLNNPVLFEGGGEVIRDGDSWMVLGVGTALLSKGRGAEQIAWEKANVDALAALAEAIWGIRSDLSESVENTDTEGSITRFLRTERGGMLVGSWEAGRWKLHDGMNVGVLRILSSPGHSIRERAGHFPVVSDTLDPVWREAVLSRPVLRHGGVSVVRHEGRSWFLVVGCTLVPKKFNSVPPVKLGAAEDRARAEWVRFTQGVQVQDNIQSTMEMVRLQQEGGPGHESITEFFSSGMAMRATGGTRMTPVGMWLADAGTDWRLAAVFRLSLDGAQSENGSQPMTRPQIPPKRQ